MSTSRPPAKPMTYFIWGVLSMAVLAALIGGAVLYSGGFTTTDDLDEMENRWIDAQGEIERLEAENQSLVQSNQQWKDQLSEVESRHSKELSQLTERMEDQRSELTAYQAEEEKVEFVANRREIAMDGLASAIHSIEGVQVQILESGLLVSGVASPFRLGSTRVQDDSLIPKLEEIARVLRERSAETETRFYAAAVGNTDITPVLQGSLHGSNLWLGAKRARTLGDLMIENGFVEDEVFLVSWGTIRASNEVRDPDSRKPQIFIVTEDFFQNRPDSE